MKNQPSEVTDAAEALREGCDWFMKHVRSLSLEAEACCADQGSYLVAAELFYFLLEPMPLADGPLSALTDDQKNAIFRLRESVRLVPVEARNGDATAAASLANMNHPSWAPPRQLANELLRVMSPVWPGPGYNAET